MTADRDPAPELEQSGAPVQVVARALGRDQVVIRDWRRQPIAYDVYLPGRQLLRVSGRAAVGEEVLDWEVVLKRLWSHAGLTPEQDEKWQREVRAYESGLLADLPGGLAAPRLLAIERKADGAVWLWLEQVVDEFGGRWELAQFGQAAYHLGAFNGGYLRERPLPDYAWLVRHWTELQSESAKIPAALAEIETLVGNPRVRATFPDQPPEQMLRLLRDQPLFKAALSRLPTLLCHHDASQANLFARHRADGSAQTVAIDWESVGYGTFGSDIATLVFGTVRRGLFAADDIAALDHHVFSGYVAGLRAAGWVGDVATVRLGYAAAIALRWFQLHGVLRRLINPTTPTRRGTALEPEEEALRQFVLITRYLLERAEEARGLLTAV